MFKLNAKFDADLLWYLLSHFECDDHKVHMLTEWHLLPPLTSTVKLSLFMHAHSSSLSLASSYINIGQTIRIILTMAGIFLDRPRIQVIYYKIVYLNLYSFINQYYTNKFNYK